MLLLICLVVSIALTSGQEKSASELLKDVTLQFTAKMFSEVIKEKSDKSTVMSPFSVLPPLAQLGLASVGESHDDILKLINLPNDNVTKEVFSPIPEQLRKANGIDLKIANRIYVREGSELNDDFAALSKSVFNSEVKSADFLKKQETANEINTWVEDQTNHRIKNLVDPESLGPDSRAVLVNAVYFKGNWLHKFNKEFTTERNFHVNKETSIKLPTMYKKDEVFYGESDELESRILELPYEGYEASFYIFLPNEIDGLSKLEDKLKDPAAISRAIQYMYTTKVDLYMPKFKIETTIDLKDLLSKLGADKMFKSSKARLDNLLKGTGDLYIGEAIQKAVIEVNEEGAEAAAANEFVVKTRSFKAIQTIQFNVDRPFYYVLMYKTIPLFCGVYT